MKKIVFALLFWSLGVIMTLMYIAPKWTDRTAELLSARAVIASYETEKFPTGYEVFDEVNKYRQEQGLQPIELYQPLCNNIAERANNYKEKGSHEGLHEFVVKYMPPNRVIGEVLNWGRTAEDVVKGWKDSPSHDLLIKEFTKACAYSANGYSVMLGIE